MRLVVMGLMGVLFFSGSVYAGQEWIVSDIARSKVNSENEYYLYLKKSGSEWDIIGFSTSNEKLSIGRMQELYQKRERPQEINSLSQFLNKNDGYERLIVNESQKTFYLSPNYIASNPALGYQPIVMSDDTKKHSCNVGWSNNRTGRIDWFEKTYTFCNSGFTKCESTTGNKIRAAVLGTMVLGLASNCQVVVDVEQVTKIPMKEFERQRVLWNVTFSEYNKVRKESEKESEKARIIKAQADAEVYKHERLLEVEKSRVRENSRVEMQHRLFEKGQESITNKSIGEMICFDGLVRNHYESYETITISAFIEDVNKNKVKIRVNGMSGNNGSIISGDVSIDGVVYRNGDVTWSDAKKWRACSL